MAQIANIAVNDGKLPTPVSHVYVPMSTVPPMYKRIDVAGQPTVAQEVVSIRFYPASKGSSVDRVVIRLGIPVLEQPNSGSGSGYVAPPKVAYELTSKHEFFLPTRSVNTDRKDLRVLAKNLLDNAQVIDVIENLAQPY